MPATPRTQLGATTTNRKWWLDVRDPQSLAWLPFSGMTEGKSRLPEATTQDDSDFDGNGYKSQTVTALGWGFDGKCIRKRKGDNAAAYDPGQEVVRKAAKTIGGVVHFRYYEMEPNGPRVEAYEGDGSPTWADDGGGMDATSGVTFTITGRGAPVEIVHPDAQAAVPFIASALPEPAATGANVVIRGTGFTGITGATGVKFGATNATSYQVLDDSTILAVVPSGSAGQLILTVGTATRNYTRAA